MELSGVKKIKKVDFGRPGGIKSAGASGPRHPAIPGKHGGGSDCSSFRGLEMDYGIEDVPAGTWCWLIHHEVLLEKSTEPLSTRVEYIRCHKSKDEVATRLKWMRPVRGELPREFVVAWEAWDKAREAWGKAWETRDKAWEAWDKALEDNRKSIEKLHEKECPGCPWDGTTLFPKND